MGSEMCIRDRSWVRASSSRSLRVGLGEAKRKFRLRSDRRAKADVSAARSERLLDHHDEHLDAAACTHPRGRDDCARLGSGLRATFGEHDVSDICALV